MKSAFGNREQCSCVLRASPSYADIFSRFRIQHLPPPYGFPLLCLAMNTFGPFRYYWPPLPIWLYLSEEAAPTELPEQVSGCLRQLISQKPLPALIQLVAAVKQQRATALHPLEQQTEPDEMGSSSQTAQPGCSAAPALHLPLSFPHKGPSSVPQCQASLSHCTGARAEPLLTQ